MTTQRVLLLLFYLIIAHLNQFGNGGQLHPSGQNLADSVGNPRGLWLSVEGIHVEIWVVSETRIRAEIQGKFLNWG